MALELKVPRMAKKKPTKKVEGWGAGQPIVLQVRGSADWKSWVEEFAKSNRMTVAGLTDFALTRLAKDLGFREPPER